MNREWKAPTEPPLYGLERWKAVVPGPGGYVTSKGISEEAAMWLARTHNARVYRSWEWVFPDGGMWLDPWVEVEKR